MWKRMIGRVRFSRRGVWDRFTETAKRAIVWAQEDAWERNESIVAPEHLLAGLLLEKGSAAARTLDRLGVSRFRLHADLEEQRPNATTHQAEEFRLSPDAKRVIDLALLESSKAAAPTLDTAHLLLGLIREGRSVVSKVLAQHGMTWETTCQTAVSFLDDEPEEQPSAPGKQTDRVTRVLQSAQAEAEARCEDRIRPDHLLSALLQDPDSLGIRVLDRIGLERSRLPIDLEERRPHFPRVSDCSVIFSRRTRWVSELVDDEVRLLQHDMITTGHVLLGLMREGTGLVSRLLIEHGADLQRARQAVAELNEDEPLPDVAEEPDERTTDTPSLGP